MNARIQRANPHIKQLRQQFERRWRQQQVQGHTAARQVYTIPVVVHLVHNNGPANLTDPQVIQAIDALNEGLRNRGVFNPQTGVDTEIEFCLAIRDPNGMATTGITRTVSPLSQLTMETEDLMLKNLIRWDPTQYLNIWVVNSITSLASGPGVAGYAYFPASHGQPEDGIVGEATYLTSQQQDISVFVHEAGHYLGLHHTFAGGCQNNNCLLDGDRVCDTPPDGSTAFVSCATSPNSCQTDTDDISLNNPFRSTALGGLGDQPDMIHNYMDYGDPFCTTAFTAGQKARMVLAITTDRASLLQSKGCISPCNQPVTANFSITNLPSAVGNTIQLQHTGSGPITGYDWTVNGQPLAQTASTSFTFPQAGTYIFSLRVDGLTPNCWEVYHDTVTVFCEPRAAFTGWKPYILPGDILPLNAVGPGTATYTWLVNGVISGTGSVFNYSSSQATSVLIQLIADHGICKDTSEARVVKVGDCGVDDKAIMTHWALDDSLLMDFTHSPPTIQKGSSMLGRILTGSNNTSYTEHSVTISDDNGDLLFYSNGEVIWDRNHQVMPNGAGIMGHHSTMEGSIAFPDPADPDIYYLFTLDAGENNFQHGLRYNKIDMRLRNGLGDVVPTAKNVLVMQTMLEVMHAVYHANGQDVWVVVGSRSGFTNWNSDITSILVTAQGVQPTPVSTPIIVNGAPHIAGLLKFSHDGQWLTSGHLLFHFDRQTGIAQFFMSFATHTTGVGGTEFSPDNSKLYFGGNSPPVLRSQIHQYDLSSGVPSTILSSKTILLTASSSTFFNRSKLEIGKDDKIYGVNYFTPSFVVIHAPNLPGTTANLQLNGFNFSHLQGGKSINLPTYVRGRIGNLPFSLVTDNLTPCPGETVKAWAIGAGGVYDLSFDWLGDADAHQQGDTLILVPTKTGTIRIAAEMRNACGIQHDTVWLQVQQGPLVDLGGDQVLCQPPILLSADFFPDVHYLWSDGSSSPSLNISQPGRYWLTATDTVSGCTHSDTILVAAPPPAIPPDLGPDQLLCADAVLPLSVGAYPSIRWWDGRSGQTHTVFESGTYWVDVVDVCGNILSDTIQVTLRPVPIRDVPDSVHLCPGTSMTVDMRSPGFLNYSWQDGQTNPVRLFDEAGVFYLQSEDADGCFTYDTLTVMQLPGHPAIDLPIDPVICEGDSMRVNVSTPGWVQYEWLHGPTGPAQTFSKSGIYTVMAADVYGCTTTASFHLSTQAPIPLPINQHIELCLGDTVWINATTQGFSSYLWQDSLTVPQRRVWDNGSYTVQALDPAGCLTSAEVLVTIKPCDYAVYMPNAFSPNDDGHNDWFGIQPRSEIASYHLVVFSRWGVKVYDSSSPTPGWDGTYKGSDSPEGVYVWVLAYSGHDGRSYQLKGSVTLIR